MAGSDLTPARRATGSRATAELTRSSIRTQLARMDRPYRVGLSPRSKERLLGKGGGVQADDSCSHS
eukprot:scaffold59538_cov61-Phaeocystis_antarctica.AAC.2